MNATSGPIFATGPYLLPGPGGEVLVAFKADVAEPPTVEWWHVRRLEEIPPLPQSTQRLLDVLSDDDVDMEDVARVIEEVGDEWAERDPPAAIAWLSSLDTTLASDCPL